MNFILFNAVFLCFLNLCFGFRNSKNNGLVTSFSKNQNFVNFPNLVDTAPNNSSDNILEVKNNTIEICSKKSSESPGLMIIDNANLIKKEEEKKVKDEVKNKLASIYNYSDIKDENNNNKKLDSISFGEIKKHDNLPLSNYKKVEKSKKNDFFSQKNTVPFLMFNFAKFGSDFISDLKSF